MGLVNGIRSSSSKGQRTYAFDSLGAIFNAPVQTHIAGRSLDHHITIQYGRDQFQCGRDNVSIGSVHTIDTDEEQRVTSPSSSTSHSMRDSSASLLTPLMRRNQPQKCLKTKEKDFSRSRRSWLPSWSKTSTSIADTTPKQVPHTEPFDRRSKKFLLYTPLHRNKNSGNKLKRKSGPGGKRQAEPLAEAKSTKQHWPQQAYCYPPSTVYAPRALASHHLGHVASHNMMPTGPIHHQPQMHNLNYSGPAVPSNAHCTTAHKIRTVQQSINSATARLGHDPYNLLLQNELSQLRSNLNQLLDRAMKGTNALHTKTYISKPSHGKEEDKIEPKESTQALPVTTEDTSKARSKGTQPLSVENVPFVQHTCSSCDATRSKSFQARHPYTPDKKPVHNVCKACRIDPRSVNVMKRYHFCYSCGIVRSKDYQRRHAAEDPSLWSRNFCSKCTKYNKTERTLSTKLPSSRQNDSSILPVQAERTTQQENVPKLQSPSLTSENPTPDIVTRSTQVPSPSAYLPGRRIGSAQRRADRNELDRDLLPASLNLDGSPSMKQYQPPSVETISPKLEEPISQQKDSHDKPLPTRSPNTPCQPSFYSKDNGMSNSQTSPLISPPFQRQFHEPKSTFAETASKDKLPRDANAVHESAARESQSRPGSNYSDNSFASSAGAFHRRRAGSPSDQHWPPLDYQERGNQHQNPTGSHPATSHLPGDDQPRFSKGAFNNSSFAPFSSSPSPPTSPHSGSSSENVYYKPRTQHAATSSSHLNQPSVFESYGAPSEETCFFESTRGAWSFTNTPRPRSWPKDDGTLPEPIIEEPASPVVSALRTPLLLEFDVSDLSESTASLSVDNVTTCGTMASWK